jgi:hypothetical protein
MALPNSLTWIEVDSRPVPYNPAGFDPSDLVKPAVWMRTG